MIKHIRWPSWRPLGKRIRRQFLTGVLVAVPLGITVWIIVWIFSAVDSILQPIVQAVVGRRVPGVGFAVTLVLIYLAGVLASNVAGRRLILYGESLLGRVPMVNMLYKSVKQISQSFSVPGNSRLLQTVLLEFPRKGIWTIGFITNESATQSGEAQLNILIPTAPNPTSGFLQICRESEVIRTGIPIEEAFKMVLSAGKMSSPEIISKLSERPGDLHQRHSRGV